MKKLILMGTFLAVTVMTVQAQRKIFYTTSGGDGGILSLATVKMNNQNIQPVLRFSPVFNVGSNFNWDFAPAAGLYTGWNIRNIGLITEDNKGINKNRYKRRVYTVGMPLAIKLGDLRKDNFFFAGVEGAVAVHYKEKILSGGDRKNKKKMNEWLSERTPRFFTSAFAGFHFKDRFNIKAQYFFNNFFNTDFESAHGNHAANFKNYDARVFFVTFGYDFDLKKIHQRARRG